VRNRVDRRRFLTKSASLVGVLAALAARRLPAAARESVLVDGPYGPLQLAEDLETSLPLLWLPAGFSYRSFSWTGDPMSDGAPTPGAHDGMGVIAQARRGSETEITLVRNHELALAHPIAAPARYDTAPPSTSCLPNSTSR
jgi:secreted PhoX family phosphatase